MNTSNVSTLMFDLDGTLCDSKKVIKDETVEVLETLLDRFEGWITTGAAYDQVKKQVPQPLLSKFNGVYCCLGTECYNPEGIRILETGASFPRTLRSELLNVFANCEFTHKRSPTIITRNAMMNFSVLEENATDKMRQSFSDWDKETGFRETVAQKLSEKYETVNFALGGMVSIDITVRGYDKSAILKNDKVKTDILFFGDRCEPSGNDYPLCRKIKEMRYGDYVSVTSPEHTLEILKKIRG